MIYPLYGSLATSHEVARLRVVVLQLRLHEPIISAEPAHEHGNSYVNITMVPGTLHGLALAHVPIMGPLWDICR